MYILLMSINFIVKIYLIFIHTIIFVVIMFLKCHQIIIEHSRIDCEMFNYFARRFFPFLGNKEGKQHL